MARINKTHKNKVNAIFAAAKRATLYALSNEFRGEECSVEGAKETLYVPESSAHLVESDGKYKVRVHSNYWIELHTA